MFNLYLTDKCTKKSVQMFSQANLIVFWKYKLIVILYAATHFKKSWDRDKINVKNDYGISKLNGFETVHNKQVNL